MSKKPEENHKNLSFKAKQALGVISKDHLEKQTKKIREIKFLLE